MEYYIIEETKIKDELSLQITSNSKYLTKIKEELDLFSNTDCMKVRAKENFIRLQKLDGQNNKKQQFKSQIEEVNNQKADVEKSINKNKTLWGFLYKSKERKAVDYELKVKLDSHNKDLIHFRKEYDSASMKAQELLQEIEKYSRLKEKYDLFNPISYKVEISETETRIAELQNRYDEVVFLEKEVNSTLGEDIVTLNKLIDDLNCVKTYKEDLNDSEDSYDRKLIHEKLEERFGNGNPGRLISGLRRKIDSKTTYIDRHITKIRKRAKDDLQDKLTQTNCKKLFIDGSNLCFRKTENVGLKPLKHLIRAIHDDYEIIIIFDSNFSKRKVEELKSQLPEDVKVVIPEFDQGADLLLVQSASGSDSSYLLSNDRFIDYKAYDVIANKRLIQHIIVDSSILVPSLDLRVPY